MKQKYKSLFKNIGIFTIGSFGSKFVAFLLIPLYTSVLSTNEYGTVDLVATTAQLLIPILLLSIQDATLRFAMDKKYNKEDVLSTSVSVILKGSFILFVGLIITSAFNIIELSIEYKLFLFATFFLGSLTNCFTLYLKAKNKAKEIAVSGIVSTLVTCICNILLLKVIKCGIIGYMFSIAIGSSVQLLYLLIFGEIYKDYHIKKYNNLSKPMIKYSLPLIANSISWWINNASDRYILSWILGVNSNGIYAISYKIPTILTTFQQIFYNAWSISAISEFDSNDSDGFLGNNYTSYSFISIFICSIIILLNIPLAHFLYANEYFEAWKYVPLLLLGTVFNGIAQLEGSLFAATKRTKDVSLTTITGAILNTIFNFILINIIGTMGAAIATAIGYSATWLLRTLKLKQFTKMKVNWCKHYITIMLLTAEAILASFNILYYVQICIPIIILILYRKFLINIYLKITKSQKIGIN